MKKKIKIGFISIIPLDIIEKKAIPVFVTLLAEKYKDKIELLAREGEEAGIELNSPLVVKVLTPILKREGIDKFIVTIPVDLREIITALEIGEVDFFVFRYHSEVNREIERLEKWLPSTKGEEEISQKIIKLDNYLRDTEKKIFSDFINLLFSISNVKVNVENDFECGDIKIGLLGELPPFSDFYIEICRYFNPVFIEIPYLLIDRKFYMDPEIVSSPLGRRNIYMDIARERELSGFVYFYYTLSSWQNYEVLFGKNLPYDFISIEIKNDITFDERDRLRIEAFYKRLNKKKGGRK